MIVLGHFDPFELLWTSLRILSVISIVVIAILVLSLTVLIVIVLLRKRRLKRDRTSKDEITIGLFHPYCNAGGGGERVLWVAVRAMRIRYPGAKFVIYTGDIDAAPDQIVSSARKRFNVDIVLDDKLEFIYLHERKWVEAERYPVFTLLGQSLGSVYLGYQALSRHTPDIFIDTMGYAFTLPLFKYIGGCKTACYVHYPTISTDMLNKVRIRRSDFNNRDFIARHRPVSTGKLIYYKLFVYLYGWAGRCSDVTMVNSSWTENHIKALWGEKRGMGIQKIFPPCDVSEFEKIPRRHLEQDLFKIVSLGQFRPEKDHPLQIRVMARVRDKIFEDLSIPEEKRDKQWQKIQLILIGGCRNFEDEERVQDLKNLTKHLAVDSNVHFLTNLPFDDLKKEISESIIGIHTMVDEHFGIAVVEMLASGLITIAHRSGGPLMDIIVESPDTHCTGFLAVNEEEYADMVLNVLKMSEESLESVRFRAQASVSQFSEAQFERGWIRAIEGLFRKAMS